MRNCSHPLIIIVILLLIPLSGCALLTTPTSAPSELSPTVELLPSTDVPAKPQEGFRAPDFALLNLAGQEVSLGDFRGQLVLINFWATWCPPCRAELPAIQAQYQNSDDLVVLGVNFQEKSSDVKPFVEAEGLTFPILLDESGGVALMYRARGLPTSFLVDAEGIVTAVHIGPMTDSQLEDYVTQARGK